MQGVPAWTLRRRTVSERRGQSTLQSGFRLQCRGTPCGCPLRSEPRHQGERRGQSLLQSRSREPRHQDPAIPPKRSRPPVPGGRPQGSPLRRPDRSQRGGRPRVRGGDSLLREKGTVPFPVERRGQSPFQSVSFPVAHVHLTEALAVSARIWSPNDPPGAGSSG